MVLAESHSVEMLGIELYSIKPFINTILKIITPNFYALTA